MALFWITQFFIGCQDMVIAGSVASWFFTRYHTSEKSEQHRRKLWCGYKRFVGRLCRRKEELNSPIRTSAWNLVRYHLGSVAMGSFLIAVVQMIRTVLQWLQARLKGSENSIAKFINRTCLYCLSCFELCIKFLTRNAYVEVGKNVILLSVCIVNLKIGFSTSRQLAERSKSTATLRYL